MFNARFAASSLPSRKGEVGKRFSFVAYGGTCCPGFSGDIRKMTGINQASASSKQHDSTSDGCRLRAIALEELAKGMKTAILGSRRSTMTARQLWWDGDIVAARKGAF